MNFIPSLGECTNPLIRFDPIKGLAVGLFNAYPLTEHLIRGAPSDLTAIEDLISISN
jgi:hypothetical protein